MKTQNESCTKTSIKDFFQKHKNEVIIYSILAGLSAVAIIIGIKNKETIIGILNNLRITQPLSDCNQPIVLSDDLHINNEIKQSLKEIAVSSHIRNLPSGQKASLAKISEAYSLGINLNEGQTIVDAYTRTQKCA